VALIKSYLLGSAIVALSVIPSTAGVITVDQTTVLLADTQGTVVGNAATSAPGFGDSSWQATGVKSNFYITPQALFGQSVLVSDISSLTYWTDQNGSVGSNWNLYIYTAPTGSGDSASWYHSRLVGIAPDGNPGWNQQSTATLDWSDPSRNNTSYSSPITWLDIEAGSVTWPSSSNSHDYTGETVEYFSLQTDSGANSFQGLLDGLTVTLNSGATESVDYAATPEPATWSLIGIGLGMAGLLRRYRR
jgi:PEP-CTERM motif